MRPVPVRGFPVSPRGSRGPAIGFAGGARNLQAGSWGEAVLPDLKFLSSAVKRWLVMVNWARCSSLSPWIRSWFSDQ